jgi:hypothetical protein
MTRIRTLALPLAVLLALFAAPETDAQQTPLSRLPAKVFDVVPPTARVRGEPGQMAIQPRACRALPTAETRRRIVDVAVQEWGFFGFRIVDQTDVNAGAATGDEFAGAGGASPDLRRGGRRLSRLPPAEAARVAASIAGYWAVTPEGAWIVERQNEAWRGPDGTAVRWNAPWSAAYISWVMCEAGLGATNQFQRAVAHHAYIDQAIRARDGRAADAAFAAYDAGETIITPGDLLCSARRPVYRTIADRRRQMGVGARTHCDIVVKVDEARERVLAIGGNVRGAVSLKLLRASREAGKPLRLLDRDEGGRPIFAHLKLRAVPLEANALAGSPTIEALGCAPGTTAFPAVADFADLRLIAARC